MTEIIIVDDDKSVCSIFQSLLEYNRCRVVGIGHNGRDAIRLYKYHRPDVIFIDICMDEYDGFYAINGIREIDPNGKIVVVTGDTSNETQERLEKLNVSAILHKPFSNLTLEHVLKTELKLPINKFKK